MNEPPNTIPTLLPFLCLLFLCSCAPSSSTPTEIQKGFSATPDPSVSTVQTLLVDPNSDFGLAFFRIGDSHLALAVVHLPSTEPVWLANPNNPARWSDRTRLYFNGSLVLSDPGSGSFWSTNTNGQRLRIRSGDLQVLDSDTVLWRSFDFPADTLLENQNFTVNMTLKTTGGGLYSMRVLDDYLGLFAEFKQGSEQLYWKRTAMQAKAQIVDGLGPIYARVNPDGFLGLYQTETAPIDVIAFASFHRSVNGTRRLRLETDGNLRGYFWNSTAWNLDYSAIQEPCGLPSECGPYGLCDAESGCSCLDGQTKFGSGPAAAAGRCSAAEYGDFCGEGGRERDDYGVLRRNGVDLAYKKLVGSEKVGSQKGCEDKCANDCGCWGAIYTNSSGLCYTLDFPVRTVVASGDETKIGFFKVRREMKRELAFGQGVFWGLLAGVAAMGAMVGCGVYGVWRWRRQRKRAGGLLGEERLEPGPYRDLDEKRREVELSTR